MSGYVPKRVSSTRTAMGTTDQTPQGYGSVMLGMLSSVGRSSSNWRAIKRRSYVTSNQQINKNRYNLHNVSKVNIVSSNGNKYVFNNGNSYDANLKYNLSLGGYKITHIPKAHPIAILNNGKESKISYHVVDNTPIIIKVSGGAESPTNGDYYTFKDSNGNTIQIGNEIFRFMRGRTYKFEADNIGTNHPFKISMNGVDKFVNNNLGNKTGISGSSGSITITIPKGHSTTAGDIYYQCGIHGVMKKNLSLLYKSVTGTTNDASYDFYYGDVNISVNGNFDVASVYCYYHGYMGGNNIFKYIHLDNL